jgi:exodeoxyribonuclease VII small subunit
MPLSRTPDGGTRTTAAAETDTEPGTFEAAFGELQHVVAQLEDGSIDLERALVLFERGNALVALCERLADEAELRVTRLAAESASPLSDVAATDS